MRQTLRHLTRAHSSDTPAAVPLTPWEQNIFGFLRSAAASSPTPVELRVVGGWVRDKLLRRDTGDIDVAVRYQTGLQFAHTLRAYALADSTRARSLKGFPAMSPVTRIAANPAMSRHLETATVRLDGRDLDFVQLRTEDYAADADHRIPTVAHGTPEQDAFRRDFTVNALFYNLHTCGVEDHTKHGVTDLEYRLLRTPLEPHITLLEDPLRALRAVRFACTLRFELCDELADAMGEPRLHEALGRKVSRERIGSEIMRILSSTDAVRGLRMIGEYDLAGSVFGDAFMSEVGATAYMEGVGRVQEALENLLDYAAVLPTEDLGAFGEYERFVLVFAVLIADTNRIRSTLGSALRREKRLQQDVRRVILDSIRLEHAVREWRSVLNVDGAEDKEKDMWIKIAEIVREAGEPLWIGAMMACAIRLRYAGLMQDVVESGITSELCRTSYAVNGNRLKAELGLKPGPEVGKALKELMRVQLWYFRKGQGTRAHRGAGRFPSGDDCVKLLKARRG